MWSPENMIDVKDIIDKKWVDVLVDLNSQQDLDSLESKEKEINILWTQKLLQEFVDKDFKEPIKIEIWAHLLRWGNIDAFKNLLPIFPNFKETDFISAVANKILNSVSDIHEWNYNTYRDQMRKVWLWDETNNLIKWLQKWLWFTDKNIDWKLWKQTIKQLKSKMMPEYNIIENNYKDDWEIIKSYILEQAKKPWLDLCSWFVMSSLEDILVKQWKKMKQNSVDARELYNSLDTKYFNKEKLSDLDPIMTKNKLVSQPKWALLTIRFEPTENRTNNSWVSHVMISMGNGTYVDYMHKQSRTIDMNKVKFDQKDFSLPDFSGNRVMEKRNYCNIEWRNYIFTPDSAILSPNIEKFSDAENKILTYKNINPMVFSKQIANEQTLPWEYVYTQMMKQNHFTTRDLNEDKTEISISIPFIKPQEFKYNITDPNVKNIKEAQLFLNTLKEKKWELMSLCNLDNIEYDNIALISFGILWNETGYGQKSKYLLKKYWWDKYQDIWQRIRKMKVAIKKGDYVDVLSNIYSKDSEYNSKWLTQIKYDGIMASNPKLVALYRKYDITEKSLDTPEKSAIATFLFLADSYEWLKTYRIWEQNYNKQMNAYKEDESWATLPPLPISDLNIFQYLPYAFNKPSEIRNATATPTKSGYIANLNTNMNNLNLA